MKRIMIREVFAEDWISRKAGERLRQMVLEAVGNDGRVEIDFEGLVIASTSFIDEGFAKLAEEGWKREQLQEKVVLKGIHPRDRALLNELFDKRQRRAQ